jgi:hypothetical protein
MGTKPYLSAYSKHVALILLTLFFPLNGAYSQTYIVGGDFDYPPSRLLMKMELPAVLISMF